MNKKTFLAAMVMFVANLLQAQTIITTDSVSGKWSAGASPYLITRDVVIPPDTSLIIEPGTEILFAGNYALKVSGKLEARGSHKEKIVFTFADSAMIDLCKTQCDTNAPVIDGWRGIRFLNNRTEKDTSLLIFCSISGVKALSGTSTECTGGGISINGKGHIVIKKCVISNNQAHLGAAIYCEGNNALIDGNLIEKNQSLSNGGAFFIYNSRPVIKNNLVRMNVSPEFGGAFYCEKSGGFLTNNTITENKARFGGAVSMVRSNIRMINNTIANNHASVNGGGLHCQQSSPFVKNSILWGNTSAKKGKQMYLYELGYPEITYSNIQGGLHEIEMFTDTLNLVSHYSRNLDEEPAFLINDTVYYALKKTSPCIDAGFNRDPLVSEGMDMKGHPRIINNVIDMGAQEFGALTNQEENDKVDESDLVNDDQELSAIIYPNPNKGKFTIEIKGEQTNLALLDIVNANGQLVYAQSFIIDESGVRPLIELDISRGIYFVELKTSAGQVLKKEKLIIQ